MHTGFFTIELCVKYPEGGEWRRIENFFERALRQLSTYKYAIYIFTFSSNEIEIKLVFPKINFGGH